jgi:hypothetical protein
MHRRALASVSRRAAVACGVPLLCAGFASLCAAGIASMIGVFLNYTGALACADVLGEIVGIGRSALILARSIGAQRASASPGLGNITTTWNYQVAAPPVRLRRTRPEPALARFPEKRDAPMPHRIRTGGHAGHACDALRTGGSDALRQVCTELPMEPSTNGGDGFFVPTDAQLAEISRACLDRHAAAATAAGSTER